MTTVSVALATFNGEKYINELLDSIEKQLLTPNEIVVSDDGSTDATLELIKAFAVRSTIKFNILKTEGKLGYRLNFMRAAKHCTSDIIAFCDQDDIWLPDKLSFCLPVFEDADVQMCYHNGNVVDSQRNYICKLYKSPFVNPLSSQGRCQDFWLNPLGLTLLFRRELTEHNELQTASIDHRSEGELPLAHDQWVTFLAYSLGAVRFIDKSLLEYRQHQDNVFGYGHAYGMRYKLEAAATLGEKQYLLISEDARRRVEVLRQIAGKNPKHSCPELITLQARYGNLDKIYKRRSLVFSRNNVTYRSKAFFDLLQDGHYLGGSCLRFGAGAMIKDLIFGVVIGRNLKRVILLMVDWLK